MKVRPMFVAALAIVSALAVPATAWTQQVPEPLPVPEEIPRDTGAGESLRVVVGGVFPSRAEAAQAADEASFGDLQGFYVVPVAQFQGMREQLGSPGDFALVSAFRTEAGAVEFLALAEGFGVKAVLLERSVRSLGGIYAGLGQEAAPDGSGPLLWPLP